MSYTATQIENAKRNYSFFLKFKTIEDENPQYVGYSVAEQRASYHNNIVSEINFKLWRTKWNDCVEV